MNDERRTDRDHRRGGRGNRQDGTKQKPSVKSTFDEHEAILGLRDYVGRAADEIGKLRARNAELAELVAELRSDANEHDSQTFLSTDDDPEKLRSRITGFIDTIDTYLERYHTGEGVDIVGTEDTVADQQPPSHSNP